MKFPRNVLELPVAYSACYKLIFYPSFVCLNTLDL